MLPDPVAPAPAIHPGDIVQITDDKHPWFPALLVVDEVRAWGVQAFAFMPANDGKIGQAFNRLSTGSFEPTGAAIIMAAPDLLAARAQSIETHRLLAEETKA